MARLGTLGLEFALVLLGVSFFLSLFANSNRRKLFMGAGISFFAAGCLVLWCCGLLALAFLFNDFSLDYVARHSSLSTPWYYRLSAVWAGQEGSCLLWLFLMMVSLGVACGQTLTADFAAQRRMFLASSLLSAGLLAITFFLNTPFAGSKFPLSDGEGLNPLLRDWAMIVHPPLLFAGYAFLAVVFALAAVRTSQEIMVPLIARWSRLAAAALTAGIALGALWAYDELGWGGYWGWDPVENASLLPWLAAFALIHFVPKNGTRLDRPGVIFAGLGFGSTILGSYLTRSGLLTSVHGFADGSFSWVWLIPLGLVVLGTAVRAGRIPAALSTGSRLILVTGLLFLVIALAVLVGTLWPVLGRLFIVKPQPLRPEFYNSVVGMLGLVLLGVLAGCALQRFGCNRRWVILFGVAVVGLAACVAIRLLFNVIDAGRLIAVFLIVVNLCFPLIEIFRGRKNPWPGLPRNLAHLGVAILAAGLTASMVQGSAGSLAFKKGQTHDLGSMQVTLQKFRLEIPEKDQFIVVADLVIRTGGKTIELHPRHRIWSDNRRRVEIDYRPGFFGDYYAILDDMNESHAALITVRRNLLVSWVWAGAVLILAASGWAGLRGRKRP